MFDWDLDDLYGQFDKKVTSTKKTAIKKQTSRQEDLKLDAEYSKKQSELKKQKREANLDNYNNVKQLKRDGSLDKYGSRKTKSDKAINKVVEKKRDGSRTKEREQNVKVSNKEKLSVSKSNPETTRKKEPDKYSKTRDLRQAGTPVKTNDDGSRSKVRTQKIKNATISSPSEKTNDQERSRTATLSKGDKLSRAPLKTPEKKEDKYHRKETRDKYSEKYDPRKKEKELERKAKESLEKIYNFNSSKNRTPLKSSINKNVQQKKLKNTRRKEHENEQKKYDNPDLENQTDICESVNSLEMPSSPKLKVDQHDLTYMAAGDCLIQDAANKIDYQEEHEYDDDFESYESDFEDYTESGVSEDEDLSMTDDDDSDNDKESDSDSSDNQGKPIIEEERKLDSGNYDLASQKQRRQIIEIKDAIQRENSLYYNSESAKTEISLKNEQSPDHPGKDKFFINFTNARQRQRKEKVKAAIQNRGDRLLEMIRLDAIGFSVLDLPSVPYEIYIQCYGKSNSIQMHTQTNEESLSEEVQTEDIRVSNKWTQHPVAFRTSAADPQDLLEIFAKERIGVGGDGVETTNDNWNYQTSALRLHNFLSAAAQVMLILLEEEGEASRKKTKSILTKTKNSGFSEGHIPLLINEISFLKGRCITHVSFSVTGKNQILTVHKASEKEPRTIQEESLGRCMLCVWSIHEPSAPQKILASPNKVSSVSFYDNFVIAGLTDGSISLWDLREKSAWHQRTGVQGVNWTLHSPTFITAKRFDESAHGSSVVSVQCLSTKSKDEDSESNYISQVATLEEEGIVIIWTVVDLLKFHENEFSVQTVVPGLAPWGRVRLVCSSLIDVSQCLERSLETKVQFRVMNINNNHIYIGTNNGLVVHCSQSNGKIQPTLYKTKTEELSNINCIEISPHEQPLFITGTSSGKVRLFLNRSEYPLVDVSGSVDSSKPAVISLQWSVHRPGVFYVLDENSSLHVWDLCNSDIFPSFSVSMEHAEPITIQISPHSDMSLLAIGTKSGATEIHTLSSELGHQPETTKKKELEIFTHYISIL